MTVLGLDVASADWKSNGSAVITFDAETRVFEGVIAPAIAWPECDLTPAILADVIDTFVRSNGICAVSLDGPQGWRDPSTAPGTPGVGRRCEYQCRTQGKTGVYPRTYPRTQRTWFEFCVDLFGALLAKPGVMLADPDPLAVAPAVGYVVL